MIEDRKVDKVQRMDNGVTKVVGSRIRKTE